MHHTLTDLCYNNFIFTGTRGKILDNGYTGEPISVNPSSHVNILQQDEAEMEWIDESNGDLKVSRVWLNVIILKNTFKDIDVYSKQTDL